MKWACRGTALRESELYEPAKRFILQRAGALFAERNSWNMPTVFCEIVANQPGEASGIWSKPDLAFVIYSSGEYIPFVKGELHTIEVKTDTNLNIQSVYEAKSHARFGHFAWLLFFAAGQASDGTEVHRGVVECCRSNGVGVMVMTDIYDASLCKIIHWAESTGTHDTKADAFIRQRFPNATLHNLRKFLSGRRDDMTNA
jgi:hypothetical protein